MCRVSCKTRECVNRSRCLLLPWDRCCSREWVKWPQCLLLLLPWDRCCSRECVNWSQCLLLLLPWDTCCSREWVNWSQCLLLLWGRCCSYKRSFYWWDPTENGKLQPSSYCFCTEQPNKQGWMYCRTGLSANWSKPFCYMISCASYTSISSDLIPLRCEEEHLMCSQSSNIISLGSGLTIWPAGFDISAPCWTIYSQDNVGILLICTCCELHRRTNVHVVSDWQWTTLSSHIHWLVLLLDLYSTMSRLNESEC